MKKCSKCQTAKPLTEFNKTKTNKDGLSYLCKDCNKKTTKAYRERNHKRYYENQKAKRSEESVFISQHLYNLKTRASKKGLEVTVTQEFLLELLQASNYKCSVTGLTMNLETHPRKKANPFKASLDRVDSSKGYTEENVQWVCWSVNQMKSDKTKEEFEFWIKTLYKAISSQA
jgi:hypothetical protein